MLRSPGKRASEPEMHAKTYWTVPEASAPKEATWIWHIEVRSETGRPDA